MAAPSIATLDFIKETYGSKIKGKKNNVCLQIDKELSLTEPISIAKKLQRDLDALSLEDRMSVEQWLDFNCQISGMERDGERVHSMLKDLNSYVKERVYFVGSTLTVADVFLYHSLFSIFEKLTFHEKEKLIHLSRWFCHVQNDKRARQSLLPVTFLRTMLYSGVGNH